MATTDELIAAINEVAKVLDDPMTRPRYILVPDWFRVALARELGCPVHQHARRAGARGRKRALYAAWRPVPRT